MGLEVFSTLCCKAMKLRPMVRIQLFSCWFFFRGVGRGGGVVAFGDVGKGGGLELISLSGLHSKDLVLL